MKKIIKWSALLLLVVLLIAGGIFYFKLNSIVESVVESQGTEQMKLKTELGSANVGLFGGDVSLSKLSIGSPEGFAAPQMFAMEDLDVKVGLSDLRGDPVRVQSITIDKPKLVIEQSGGKFNFKKAIEGMPPSDSETELKLIINELTIKDPVVVVRPGINFPGVADEITVPIPTISMKNIGSGEGAQNGAALKDIAQQVITVMAANASNSELIPEELRGLLSLDVQSVVSMVGSRLGAEARNQIAKAIPGELGARVSEALADPSALLKDPSKALDSVKENLGKEIGGNLDVETIKKDPGKAVEGLKGLFDRGEPDSKKTKENVDEKESNN